MKRSSDDEFLRLLEKAVRDILANDLTKPSERLKAVEQGAKLLAIRHKIEGGDSGSFFGASS